MNERLNKPIDVKKLYETLLKYISKKGESHVEALKIKEKYLKQIQKSKRNYFVSFRFKIPVKREK
ncbi:MAG: hypothetical protein WC665_02780 [Sulfurimonas sp.]|jgi:hypothetical protein